MRAEDFEPGATEPAWLAPLQAKLDDAGLGRASYALRLLSAQEGQGGALEISKKHHGLASVQLLSAAQLLHGELRQLIDVATQLDGLLQLGATVSRGGRSHTPGFAEDHLALADGLLVAHAALGTTAPTWARPAGPRLGGTDARADEGDLRAGQAAPPARPPSLLPF